MPKAYPEEFRSGVVALARKREIPWTQIAKDFGISEAAVHNRVKKADIADGLASAPAASESAELREARKRIRLLEQDAEVMRRAVAYLSRDTLPLVLDLAAKEAPVRVPVAVTCRVLGFSKQGFYQWRKYPVTQRDWDDAALINAASDVHHDDPEFVYRLITDGLRDLGHSASKNRVGRLCGQQRIYSAFAKKKGLRGKPGPAVHDDRVKRKFTAEAANTLWLTASPSTARMRASCICARSTMSGPIGSSATRSTRT